MPSKPWKSHESIITTVFRVTAEPGISVDVIAQLERWGHDMNHRTTIGGVGGAQLIMFDRTTGTMSGGSTPTQRRNGRGVFS